MTPRLLTIRGESRSVKAWSRLTKVSYTTIINRLGRHWSDEDAVFKPVRKGKYATRKKRG